MKKYLFLSIVVLFASCSPFGLNWRGYDELSEPLNEAWAKSAALEGIPDGRIDYWQSPRETEIRGGGDCEDIAIYLVYLLGRDADLVIIQIDGVDHAIVGYRGKYVEPQIVNTFYSIDGLIVRKTYSYDLIMAITTKCGMLSVTS